MQVDALAEEDREPALVLGQPVDELVPGRVGQVDRRRDRAFLQARQRPRVDQRVLALLRAQRDQPLDLGVARELLRRDLDRALERDLRRELRAVLLDVVDARLAILRDVAQRLAGLDHAAVDDLDRLGIEAHDFRVRVDLELDRLALERDVLEDALHGVRLRLVAARADLGNRGLGGGRGRLRERGTRAERNQRRYQQRGASHRLLLRTLENQLAAACTMCETWPARTITQRSVKPPTSTSSAGRTVCGMRCPSSSPCSASGTTMPASTTTPQKASGVRSAGEQRGRRGVRGRRRVEVGEQQRDQHQLDREKREIGARQLRGGAARRRFPPDRLPQRGERAADETLRRRSSRQHGRREVDQRGAGGQARQQEERAENRAVPQRPRDHRVEQNAGIDAERDAEHHVRPAEHPDDTGARGEPVGGVGHGRHGAPEPRPRVGQPQQRRRGEDGVDEEQHPRAPRHRRARLEGDVDAPHVELVREIEEQRAACRATAARSRRSASAPRRKSSGRRRGRAGSG